MVTAWRRVPLRASVSTLAFTVLGAAAGVLSGIALARTLGPAVRGELASVVVWATVLAIAGDLGIGHAVSYQVARRPADSGGLWTQCLVFGLGVGSALAVISGLVLPRCLELPHLPAGGAWLGLAAIPFSMAATHQGFLLLGAGYLRAAATVRLVAPALHGVGVAAVALTGHASVPLYLGTFLSAHVAAFCAAAYLSRSLLAVRLDLRMRGLRRVLRYGMTAQLATLAVQAGLRLDQLLLSVAVPAVELGRYVVAAAVASALAPLFTASALVVSRAVLTAPSRSEGAASAIVHLKWTAALASGPFLIGVAACGWLLPRVFGPGFEGAAAAARVLLVAALFQGCNTVLGAALRNVGSPGSGALAEGVGLAVTALLLIVLLPPLGILGAALASSTGAAAATALLLLFTLRAAHLEPEPSPGVPVTG